MRFKLYREYGALNSPPVFDAVEQGLKQLGHTIVHDNEDVSVIWSVLWSGRMRQNKLIYDRCQQQGRVVMIIEVGNLKRGETWRISLDHINNLGKFGNDINLDPTRPEKLGVKKDKDAGVQTTDLFFIRNTKSGYQVNHLPEPVNSIFTPYTASL